ncbi:TIGR00341 family protein [bacterium]|nr:TIGR00341 family protein [bacterium]
MAIRLLEIYLPEEYEQRVQRILDEYSAIGVWRETIKENQAHVQLLVPAEACEPIIDILEKQLSGVKGFRIVIIPVAASIPRPKEKEEPEPEETKPDKLAAVKTARVSREELYADIAETIKLNWVYITLVALSTIVAAAGLLKDNVAVTIGAMVIAPLLGPNVGLSLATTLGDVDLTWTALRSNAVGIFTALVMSVVLGFLIGVDPTASEIATRTQVDLGDIALALAAGSAGALAFTTGIPTMLVGVMVAVALLPPLVVLGLLIGAGYFSQAWGALFLLLTNLICVNLSGVLTFLAQGVRPLSWWEAEKAKKATRRAIIIWCSLLIALAVIIVISKQ